MAQAEDAHEGGLQFEEFLFAFVLYFCAVTEGFLQQNQVAAEFHLGEDEAAQSFERLFLFGLQLAGSLIDDAERAESVAVFVDERSAGVEADVRVGNDERIIAESVVLECVRNHENIGLQNSVRAEGDFARGLRCVEADA